MSTDITRYDTAAVAPHNTTRDALRGLSDWVAAAGQAGSLVASIIDTPFIPDVYRPRVSANSTPKQIEEARQVAIANATAAVLQGTAVGLDPLTSLQQIFIIHGRPGMYAKAKVALLKSHGHEVWTEDLNDSRAVVCGRRAGEERVERVVITIAMAKQAGWTSNTAYAKTPQDMLWARAAGRVCDRIAPDRLMGISSVEDIEDEAVRATAEVGPAVRTVRPRRAKAQSALIEAAEEPSLDDEPAPATVEAAVAEEPSLDDELLDGPRLITAPQQRKLHALLRERGVTERDAALVKIAGIIGREVESTKDLTIVEASQVIDHFATLAPSNWPEPTEIPNP